MSVKNLKTISIKGKQYVEVKERILFLSSQDEFDYSITTDYQYYAERKMWVVRAKLILYKDGKKFVYTGLAQEVESEDYRQVNHTSALENAETSAVGRACAMAGIGVIDSMASADEMQKASNRTASATNTQTAAAPVPVAAPAPEDERPWLSDRQCEQAVEKIKSGNKDIYQKTLEVFKVNKKHREALEVALKSVA
ncbi:hypothetical protein GXP67_27920 [Rhodocytophaga rosea]|uniref:Uncharacterized protein n=1 Tax=Rhodocytophaga rosea TaxID=2704465 RepID=A0A6C0GRT6_9BACT|nr:hypothetical protein [Rhodocytophaga rosea]QHT70200.1 hypothetical protein GXP67_27920 [Rhodocytophaga rosea]